jgi:hypothetical protein
LDNSRLIFGVGATAFALLCWVCLAHLAPQLESVERAQASARSVPAGPLAPPTLNAKLVGDRVVLEGALPDEAAKRRLLARAEQAFGAGKYVDKVRVQDGLANQGAAWLPAALSLLPLATRVGVGGGFELRERTVTLSGRCADGAEKAALIKEAMTAVGSAFSINDRLAVSGPPLNTGAPAVPAAPRQDQAAASDGRKR